MNLSSLAVGYLRWRKFKVFLEKREQTERRSYLEEVVSSTAESPRSSNYTLSGTGPPIGPLSILRTLSRTDLTRQSGLLQNQWADGLVDITSHSPLSLSRRSPSPLAISPQPSRGRSRDRFSIREPTDHRTRTGSSTNVAILQRQLNASGGVNKTTRNDDDNESTRNDVGKSAFGCCAKLSSEVRRGERRRSQKKHRISIIPPTSVPSVEPAPKMRREHQGSSFLNVGIPFGENAKSLSMA